MISTEQISGLMNDGVVVDETDSKIGKVGQVYLDDESGNPEWVTASTGFFGTSETFIPLRGADADGSKIRVPYSKDKIKDAPRMEDAEGHLSPDQENELYRYYGLDTGTSVDSGTETHGTDTMGTGTMGRDNTGTNVRDEPGYVGDDRDRDRDRSDGRDVDTAHGRDTSGPNSDDAMTRSEEQVHVGTEQARTGKARLRKHVVTENVTQTVPVSHEEVRVEREPITDANRGDAMAGGDLTEEEHDMTLSEERVVVDKETVPVERVRMDKDTVTEEQQVSEDVRKEQIDADTSTEGGRRDTDSDRRDTDRQ